MSGITRLHDAVRGGDLSALATLLAADPKLSNARSETDPRGTYPLHVAAEFGQAEASLRSTAPPAARKGSGSAFPTPRWKIGADASSCFAPDTYAIR